MAPATGEATSGAALAITAATRATKEWNRHMHATTDTMIIGSISAAMATEREHRDLIRRNAAHLFGRVNGWRTGKDVRDFDISDIGKRVGSFARLGSDLFDHCIWYRSIGQCAAIVAQPYPHADDDHAKHVAAKHRVACHIPPHPRASFHVPGSTKFYVFTLPDHQIVWLPEQIHGIAS
jgi:hypothetical protein